MSSTSNKNTAVVLEPAQKTVKTSGAGGFWDDPETDSDGLPRATTVLKIVRRIRRRHLKAARAEEAANRAWAASAVQEDRHTCLTNSGRKPPGMLLNLGS